MRESGASRPLARSMVSAGYLVPEDWGAFSPMEEVPVGGAQGEIIAGARGIYHLERSPPVQFPPPAAPQTARTCQFHAPRRSSGFLCEKILEALLIAAARP